MDLKAVDHHKSPSKRILLMSTSESKGRSLAKVLADAPVGYDVKVWTPGQMVTPQQGWHCILLHLTHFASDLASQYEALSACGPMVLTGSDNVLDALNGDHLIDMEWLNIETADAASLAIAIDMAVLKYRLSAADCDGLVEEEPLLNRDAFFQAASNSLTQSFGQHYFQIIQCRWVKPSDTKLSWQDSSHLQRRFDRFLASYVKDATLVGRLMDEQSGLLSVNEKPMDVHDLDNFRQLCQREFSDVQVVIYTSTATRVDSASSLGMVMQQAVQEIARDKLVQEAQFEWQSFEQANVGLTDNMHLALQRQEFFLQYQPQLDVATGEWVGAEALIRWRHPSFGVLPPTAFIREAENTGLIQVLGRWALHEAIRAWKTIVIDTGKKIRMAVNIAFPQVADEEFPFLVLDALEQNEMPAKFLELELTETTVIKNESTTTANLQRLLKAGIKISLDDFGTGFSSLSHLSDLPISGIKLDRAFVSPLPEEGPQAHIASAMVGLAKQLKLETTAEGVEDARCMEKIQQLGCDRVQGYYFARPLSLEDLLNSAEYGFNSVDDSAPAYGS